MTFPLLCELPGDLPQLTSFFLDGVDEPRPPLVCFNDTLDGVGVFRLLFDGRMLEDELFNWLELFNSEAKCSPAPLIGDLTVSPC